MIFLLSVLTFLSSGALAMPVTVHFSDLVQLPEYATKAFTLSSSPIVELNLSDDEIAALARKLHTSRNRCGGFVAGESYAPVSQKSLNDHIPLKLTRQPEVLALLPEAQEANLKEFILWFSSFKTRNFSTDSGVQAMNDLADRWRALVKNVPHAEVTLYQHAGWRQPSVILKFKGESAEEIILGGHGDSINTDSSDPEARSPGADDNAAGIGVITEVIRILADKNYRPKSTLTFMAYAAEEVGLRGSMDISADYLAKGIPVKSVLQFDGTNYKGSQDLGLVLIEDLVDPRLNTFLEKLITTYLKLPFAYDSCGYACSDHYSWTYRGFSAAFPFESRIKEENPHFHTARDLLSVSQDNAYHAVPFVRLGLSYMLEMDQ
jgi:bacterial leucyl aminopeptidase